MRSGVGGSGNDARLISVPRGPAGTGLIGFATSQTGGIVRQAAMLRSNATKPEHRPMNLELNLNMNTN